MVNDSLTEVDTEDNVIGPMSKVDGHLHNQENPHRAFSLFLFNSKNELLFQQRSQYKITFPGLWTNTCCSHPSHTEAELDSNAQNGYLGARRAAIRRTDFEMGIKDLEIGDLKCGSRILYYAPACETFAEYELDYIIFAKKDIDLSFEINQKEVSASEWVSRKDLLDFM